ncbi:Methylated-DNA--protein-cysteine methyltransferase [Roseovarius litorisediminis]|uniref:Methylated-DNA--protein-cysteine methyltransferase n=1 Tax=Roseovarius litorisediminis TaxID=1312363 RepID=A0A1Y5SIY1_9RHOB|nr:methylated-DNA--[protein]-cysteine S-methyltransferase [Roseovarius litorisediminis]SLN41551.1 Methylated-DNA--protein-cysteine methyltransferase [Roseovarius litorisediminis]
MPAARLDTPLGLMTVVAQGGTIRRLSWEKGAACNTTESTTPELDEALRQLRAYFDGRLGRFDLPLYVEGSDFQRAVCDAMLAIRLGDTRTYGDLAADLNASAQAVGNACGGNPIPVIIPCHRILGASSLGGFSGNGGVESKVWLLRHEGAAGLLI